jgi:DNA modification methylase
MLESGLYNVDCFDGLREINDKSIDLVLTDPPYNIGIAEWDKIPDYINWCGRWIKQCERVLKNTGSFYFWHNDMPQVAQLMEWIRQNTRFVFNSFCIWDKGDFRALSWKNPSEKNNLRSWFNTCEYCLLYTFQDKTGLSTVMLDTNNFPTMRGYFKRLQEYIGQGLKQINAKMGHRKAEHAFYWKTTQWDMPTPETYQQLIDAFEINKWGGFREYEDLRREYEDLRREYEDLRREYEDLRFVHNLEKDHNNVWRCAKENKTHICEKPQSLLTKIIRCSTNSGGLVLDLFAGSASTAIAAHRTGRRYICFEKDADYFKAASERLEREKATVPLFEP